MIRGMAFVSYPVSDIDRAVAFYRDAIGLTPGETFGSAVVEFDVGLATFAVDAEAIGEPGSQSSAAFEVDDVHAMRAKLAQDGVTVTEVMVLPPCFMAVVTDPDGNRFAIHERKPNNLARTVLNTHRDVKETVNQPTADVNRGKCDR